MDPCCMPGYPRTPKGAVLSWGGNTAASGGGGAKFETMLLTRAAGAGTVTQNIALADDLAASVFNGFWAHAEASAQGQGPGSTGSSAPIFGALATGEFVNSQFGPVGGVTVNHITGGPTVRQIIAEVRDLVAGTGWQVAISFPVAGQVRVTWTQIGAGISMELGLLVLGG